MDLYLFKYFIRAYPIDVKPQINLARNQILTFSYINETSYIDETKCRIAGEDVKDYLFITALIYDNDKAYSKKFLVKKKEFLDAYYDWKNYEPGEAR